MLLLVVYVLTGYLILICYKLCYFRTKETLASGHFMSVINILMQLRKVCNHPSLFDPRPIVSPFQMEGLVYNTSSLVLHVMKYNPLEVRG